MTYEELKKRALEIRAKYDTYNAEHGNGAWGTSELMSGFVGDVGDLSKIIMAKQGLREMDNVDAKLAHELADCLWSVLVLADKFGIALDKEFMKTMDGLEERIAKGKG